MSDAPSPAQGPSRWEHMEMPAEGRLLGLDHGTVRVGVAASDTGQAYAAALETYVRTDPGADAAFFKTLAREYEPAGLVVGLPVRFDGAESSSSTGARAFGRWVAGVLKLPLAFHDERATSAAADDIMRDAGLTGRDATKSTRDKLAARIILQSYLDSRRPAGERVAAATADPTLDPAFAPLTEPVRGRDKRKLRKQRRGKKGW